MMSNSTHTSLRGYTHTRRKAAPALQAPAVHSLQAAAAAAHSSAPVPVKAAGQQAPPAACNQVRKADLHLWANGSSETLMHTTQQKYMAQQG
jgi:hypothetical protein